ncbi:putative lipoprotein transmembrane [Paraburkholderia piptadeniae]|uniref:Lipoprotein transmembrane n=2 Tax=Paraburkholderia piptadeniae TaxID=1701573 RepID=A0A1N7RN23_9BURK|nr:putative lipoprotein transmembrane [Paraburkholderia piptadeniae]
MDDRMNPSRRTVRAHAIRLAALAAVCGLLGACAVKEAGYGVGVQAEREAKLQQSARDAAPDTPGMYLGLIDGMQRQGLYYASLAHIDAYEKQYGASPDSILLRADALRTTDQPAASAAAYTQLLNTPLAARGYRGLGLLAGASGDFERASQALETAVELAPTDVATLSDLGYARLRAGDIAGARVPLMKAAELDGHNQKVIGNVVLYLLADGQTARAQALIKDQKIAPDVRTQIRDEAAKVTAASRARRNSEPRAQKPHAASASGGPVASVQDVDQSQRMLQRFAQ